MSDSTAPKKKKRGKKAGQELDVPSMMRDLTIPELETQTKRVTQEEIKKVTPEQVQQVMELMSREQLHAVLQTLVESNRFPDVVHGMNEDVFKAALTSSRDDMLHEAAVQLQGHHSFQSTVLGSMTTDYKDMCTEFMRAKQQQQQQQ